MREEEIYVKREIQKLIVLQQQLQLSGGVSETSNIYLELNTQQRQVLGLFGIIASRQNTKKLGSYPFSLVNHNFTVTGDTLADFYWCKWIGAYFLEGCLVRGFYNDDSCFANIHAKTEFLYWRLSYEVEENNEIL